jgi:hypothetical protein
MTYETKSGARYMVRQSGGVWGVFNHYGIFARQKGINAEYQSKKSAEAALKAYADAHRWKVVEG